MSTDVSGGNTGTIVNAGIRYDQTAPVKNTEITEGSNCPTFTTERIDDFVSGFGIDLCLVYNYDNTRRYYADEGKFFVKYGDVIYVAFHVTDLYLGDGTSTNNTTG